MVFQFLVPVPSSLGVTAIRCLGDIWAVGHGGQELSRVTGQDVETGVESLRFMMGTALKEELIGTQAQSYSRALCSLL